MITALNFKVAFIEEDKKTLAMSEFMLTVVQS